MSRVKIFWITILVDPTLIKEEAFILLHLLDIELFSELRLDRHRDPHSLSVEVPISARWVLDHFPLPFEVELLQNTSLIRLVQTFGLDEWK